MTLPVSITEETLVKAGALQSAIFNSAHFSSIATDEKGVIQIFNVGAERMLGYTAAEVINKITPADISDPQEVIERAKELSVELGTTITPGFEALVFKAYRGIEDIYELTYIRKDGSRFPAVVSVTALRDEQDAIIGYLLIGTDNTARKQAEAALAKAGALQSAIFNSVNFSSIATDANGVIQIFNVGAERMLGYTAAEVINKITPADISDPQELIERAKALSVELGTPITSGFEALAFKASRGIEDIYELTKIRKDGSRFPAVVSVTALRDDQDAIIGYLLIGTDNTARKLAEDALRLKAINEELRKSGDFLRKLIQCANAPIIVWDPNFIIIRFNRAFERLSGYAADEVIDKPVSMLFPENSWTATLELMDRSQGRLQWEGVEIPIRRKNGEVRIALWSSANIYEADGVTLTAVIAQGQDITERAQRERELLLESQQANRVQNAMLAAPAPSEYLDIATCYRPFGYVGGDLYFLNWRYDDSLLRGFLVDATGHGFGTALNTASLHVLLREVNELDLPLSEALRWINRRAGKYFAEETFAGALGFEFDLQTRQLKWACAGIPKIYVATKTLQGAVERPGMFLGINEDETFEENTMPVDVGDSFYFVTDGLTDLLEGWTSLPLDRHPEMIELLWRLSESPDRRDDATAVCIHVSSLPQALVRQDGWPRIIRFNGYGDYRRLKGEVAKILAEVTGLPHSLEEVAVHEALANAMECRDGVPRQHKARLRFNKVGNLLIARVKTSRIGFAGNTILRRLRAHPEEMFSFGEDAAMGRGIPMMLSMSQRMTYNNEGTEVLLAWKLD
ncbi:MAG TPA: PAS domain S-box protein [Negativicutes bacterium]|nr:PAS domain S-box protein [Negativicutes bacterium]